MYSIKTDLGVTGTATVDKDLLVKGNAVFKQNVTIEGTVNFADAVFTSVTSTDVTTSTLEVSTSATIKDASITGNASIGTDATSVVSVKGKSTFSEDVAVQKNITQPNTGTATLGAVAADSLTVTNASQFNGNVTAAVGTTTKLDTTEVGKLTVNGETIHKGVSSFEQTATFDDVVINGTLSGTYTVENGSFTTLTVSGQSTLNDVYASGNIIADGNITASNSTATFNRLSLAGQTANITFAYSDPARPTDIKTAIQPYRVSSSDLLSNTGDVKRLSTGDVTFADYGFTGKGISKMDYLDLTGNTTLALSRPRLEVKTGLVKVHDLEITGAVTGLTFADGTFDTITVNGISTFKGAVNLDSNIVGSAASTATFNRFIVSGTAGSNGSITFNYTDSGRPLDIRTALSPYAVTSQEITSNIETVNRLLTVGTESNITSAGLVSKGRSTFDYLDIKGNSTEVASKPKLQVAGKTVLEDLEITGQVSGITFDLTGQDINLNSLTATTSVTAESVSTGAIVTTDIAGSNIFAGNVTVNGQTVTVKDLVVTGATTGVTAVADVDGLNIAPATVTATSGTFDTITGDSVVVNGDISITGSVSTALKAPSVAATGQVKGATVVSEGSLTGTNVISTGTALSTFTGDVTVGTGTTTTVHDLVVTGIASGIQVEANVDGLDIAPKSVTVTEGLSAATATVTGGVNAGSFTTTGTLTAASALIPSLNVSEITNDVTMHDVELNILTAGEVLSENATVRYLTVSETFKTAQFATDSLDVATPGAELQLNAKTKVVGDLAVTGTLTPAAIDLSTTDVAAKSLTTTGDVTVGGALDVSNANLSAKTYTATDTEATNVLPKMSSSMATLTVATISTLNAANINGAANFTGSISGAGGLKIVGNADVSGTLTVATLVPAAIDLSTTDVEAKSLTTTGNVSVGGDLTVTGAFDLSSTNLVAASLASSSTVTVATDLVLTTGNITGAPKISGNTTMAGTLGVTGATTLSTLSTSGLATLNSLSVSGASTLAATTVASLSTAGNITMTGTAGTATLYSTRITNTNGGLIVGAGAADAGVAVHVKGAAKFDGNVTVSGSINGTINLDGQNISPAAVTTSGKITAGTDLDVTATLKAPVAMIGTTAHAAVNALQINGNVVCNGDFNVVAPGKIIGQLDMTTSVVEVAGVTSSGKVTTATLQTTGLATLQSLTVSGVSTFTGDVTAAKLTSSDLNAAKLTVTGPTVLGGASTTISSTAVSVTSGTVGLGASTALTVAGTSTFTGAVTTNNLTVTGTLTADIANLVTNSVNTKKYLVKADARQTSVSGAKTPGLNSNVDYWVITDAVTVSSILGSVITANSGNAGSWFLYLEQDATGGRAVTFGSGYAVNGAVATAAGSVSIAQLVYCGYGNIVDVFIAQRT